MVPSISYTNSFIIKKMAWKLAPFCGDSISVLVSDHFSFARFLLTEDERRSRGANVEAAATVDPPAVAGPASVS